jgi:hypothetical protein
VTKGSDGLETVNILVSRLSHTPLHFVLRESGAAEKHGFHYQMDICNVSIPGRPVWTKKDRAPQLLDGAYHFCSGLHHEPYRLRANGDRRLAYLAQTQNDWDDRLVVRPEVTSVHDLEDRLVLTHSSTMCTFGNFKRALQRAGADVARINFEEVSTCAGTQEGKLIDMLARGEAVAASVDIPFDRRAEKLGLKTLALPRIPVIHNTTLCANLAWVQASRDNEDLVRRYLMALIEAIHFFKTQKDLVCAILERELAPILNLQGYDEVEHLQLKWSELLCTRPYPDALAVWNVYDLDVAHDPRVSMIGSMELWDLHYLRQVEDSGFIDRLLPGALQILPETSARPR